MALPAQHRQIIGMLTAQTLVSAVMDFEIFELVAPPTAVSITLEGFETGGGLLPGAAADVGVIKRLIHGADFPCLLMAYAARDAKGLVMGLKTVSGLHDHANPARLPG